MHKRLPASKHGSKMHSDTKIPRCKSNPEKSSITKVSGHIPSGSLSTILSFKNRK